jgi:hypothetical protein
VPMTCYGYPADLPPGDAKDAGAQAALSDARKMPFSCYSYPNDLPRGGNSDAAQPHRPQLRRMPNTTCFTNTTCFRY